MAKGVIKVPCKPEGNNDPLLKDSINHSATTAVTTNIAQFTIPTGRGDVKAIQVFIGSNTIGDYTDSTITLKVNGTSILDDEALLPYSPFFSQSNQPMLINLPEGANITGSVTNGSGNTFPVIVDLFFFDPYKQ